ncbi:bifunctional DNA primase/polymerase [Streptomyces hokutonensis]|uniref:bifunctional DNA primase/polymerase n=1 Tax=Streptomyces hokutonensis TaxID=1306990 RepID=UPI000372FD21|nr:bifunctional DNA primase/polymerase [Streptomyces hokutonensis]
MNTQGHEDAREDASPPANWSAKWQHRPLRRAQGEEPRRPLIRKPENLAGSPYDTPQGRELSERYWEQVFPQDWETVSQMTGEGFDVALMPAISGLVVIDCDVKEYEEDTGYVAGFVKRGRVVSPAPKVVKRGIDDLQREVERLGHTMAELATYAVSTKSGGVHLYYQSPPRLKLKTMGHRDNWRVDIVAHNDHGDRSWVAAPPTTEYQVIRDLRVAQMPTWLAEFLRNEVSTWPKPGGQRRQAATRVRQRARADYERAVTPGDRRDYYREWIAHELYEVELANQHGGWNDALNRCAWTLFTEAELPYAVGRNLILTAAAPVNTREERKALDTINSAWRAARPGDNSYLEA